MRVAIFAILALAVASARAELGEETMTQLGLSTSNDQETAQLAGNLLIFEDFCLQSRDYLAKRIKNEANDLSARVFSFFFDSGELILSESLDVIKVGNERLTAQLLNPDAQIAEPTNEAEKLIAPGQQKIKEIQFKPKAYLEAFKTNVGAFSQNVKNRVTEGIDNLKKFANIENLVRGIQDGCRKISVYEEELSNQFASYKVEVAKNSPESDLFTPVLNFSDVPCATTKKIRRAEAVCTLALTTADPIKKLYNTRIPN